MACYVFRYFFDGCGDCLWPANHATEEKFGSPVFLEDLDLSDKTVRRGNEIIHQACLMEQTEPDVYGVSYSFSPEEIANHRKDVAELLFTLRQELGPDYEIVDESRI